MITIVIGGDLCPGTKSTPKLREGHREPVFGPLLGRLESAQVSLANLEGPLVARSSPITKIGPHHSFAEECIEGLYSAGFRLLNLANNHIMDHGYAGLTSTIGACRKHAIDWVGAGENLAAAAKPWVGRFDGLSVAILSYTEHEFGLATAVEAGANPLDLPQAVRTIQACRSDFDYVIVLIHGGNEYYQYPRPSLQDLCRFLVEQGASAVICQHSHCVGAYESYRGGHIVYGQGNLLCDNPGPACEREGMLVVLQIAGDRSSTIDWVPFEHASSSPGPVPLTGQRRDQFLEAFQERSRAIQDPEFVQASWEQFCGQSSYNYLSLVHGYPQRIRELDRKLGFLRFVYSRKRLLMLLHLLRCESHREAIISALSSALK